MAETYDRCAAVADGAVKELQAILDGPQARKSHWDKQTPLQIKYAIRWVKKVAERIRAMKPAHDDGVKDVPPERFKEAQALLKELRPTVAQAGASHWRAHMLQRIDALLK